MLQGGNIRLLWPNPRKQVLWVISLEPSLRLHLDCLVQETLRNHPHHSSMMLKTQMESKSIPITHGNLMTKFTLTRHQHKAEILWGLKTVMSHFSYTSAADIADVLRAMFPDSAIAQKWCHILSVLALHHILSNSFWMNWRKPSALLSHLMSHLILDYMKNRWTLWWGTSTKTG